MTASAVVLLISPVLPGVGGLAQLDLLEQERSIAASVVFDGVAGGGGFDDEFISAAGFAVFDQSISLSAGSPDEGESHAWTEQTSWIERHGFGFELSTVAQTSSFGVGSNGDASSHAVFLVRFTLDRNATCAMPFALDYSGQIGQLFAVLTSSSGVVVDLVAQGEQPNIVIPPGEYVFEARIGGEVAAQDNNSSDLSIVMSGALYIVPSPGTMVGAMAGAALVRRRRRG